MREKEHCFLKCSQKNEQKLPEDLSKLVMSHWLGLGHMSISEPVTDQADGKNLEPSSLPQKLGLESMFMKYVTIQKKGEYVNKTGMFDQREEQIDKLGR